MYEDDPAGSDGRVEAWRLARLLDAGYSLEDAERLAAAPHVDLHAAIALVKTRGCDLELATRILL